MQTSSTRLGDLEVSADKVIHFPDGILGFEKSERFVLVSDDPANPFKWLCCLDDPQLAFVVIEPFEFLPAYEFELSRDDVETLGLASPAEAAIFSIVVVPEDPSKVTANLLAPLVINVARCVGRQVVLQDKRYSARHLILEELKAHGGSARKRDHVSTGAKSDSVQELFVAVAGGGR